MLKRLIVSSILLAAFLTFAADTVIGTNLGAWLKVRTETYTVANSLATNVAALTATSGVDFNGGGGVAAAICAESTRTISSGNMRAYIFMPEHEPNRDGGTGVSFLWIPYAPLDVALATGNRCALTGDKQSWTGQGRIAWVEDDVAVSGGTTIEVTYTRRLGAPIENH